MGLVVEVEEMGIVALVEALVENAVEADAVVGEDLAVETKMRLDLTVCLPVEHLVVML
jgi:hypothetical protein